MPDHPAQRSNRAWPLPALAVAAGAVILVALLALLLGNLTYQPAGLKRAVVGTLKHYHPSHCVVGRALLVPLRRLTIDSLVLAFPDSGGGLTRITVEHVVVTYHPLALLRSSDALRQALKDSYRSAPGKAITRFQPLLAKTLVTLHVQGMQIDREGHREMSVDVAGMTVTLCFAAAQPRSCTGSLTATTLVCGRDSLATGISSALRLDSTTLAMDSLRALLFAGALNARLALDVNTMRLDTASAELTNAKLSDVYAATEPEAGSLRGSLSVTAAFNPSPLRRDSLSATGSLMATSVKASASPLQQMLASILGSTCFTDLAFDTLSGDFALNGTTLTSRRLAGTGSPLSFASAGRISFAGSLYQNLSGVLDRHFTAELKPSVRSIFADAPGGRSSFHCVIKGTLDQPILALDKETLQRAVKGAFLEFKQSVGDKLK